LSHNRLRPSTIRSVGVGRRCGRLRCQSSELRKQGSQPSLCFAIWARIPAWRDGGDRGGERVFRRLRRVSASVTLIQQYQDPGTDLPHAALRTSLPAGQPVPARAAPVDRSRDRRRSRIRLWTTYIGPAPAQTALQPMPSVTGRRRHERVPYQPSTAEYGLFIGRVHRFGGTLNASSRTEAATTAHRLGLLTPS